MTTRPHLMLLSYYNKWANRRVLGSISSIADKSYYRKSLGLPCDSIHSTMSHMYIAEQLWMQRLNPHHIIQINGKKIDNAAMFHLWSVDAPASAWGDFFDTHVDDLGAVQSSLAFMLDEQSEDWINLTRASDELTLKKPAEYFDTEGKAAKINRAHAYMHVFNHSTHHRGQLSAAVAMSGTPYPQIDLSYFLPEWENIHSKALKWMG